VDYPFGARVRWRSFEVEFETRLHQRQPGWASDQRRALDAGFIAGKPAYVILYGEACYNSKRQARRTVDLYNKYKDVVQFVIIDLDHHLSPSQDELKKKYYTGYIPQVVVLDNAGTPLYNSSGEVDASVISNLLDKALR
jgi:hypothetical protein